MFNKEINDLNLKLVNLNSNLDSKKDSGKKNQVLKNGNFLAIFLGVCIEFLSGGSVGFLIGYCIDLYFKTAPLAIIIFFCLGFMAGLLNVYRYLSKLLLTKKTVKVVE